MEKSVLNKQVAVNIRNQRMLAGLSQGQFAKLLGVNNSYISTLEGGLRNPSVRTLEKIARTLNILVTALVESSTYTASLHEKCMPLVSGVLNAQENLWQGKTWYHQRFDGSPYLIHMIAEAEITTRRDKKYGLHFDRHFCFFEDGKADWYIDMADIERSTAIVLELFKTYPQLSQKLMEEYKPFEDAFYAACRKIGERNLHELTNRRLIEVHDEFLDVILTRNSSSSIIDGFALGTDRLLEERIKHAYDTHPTIAEKYRFSEVFSALTVPSHSSFVRDAELDLFKLILRKREHPEHTKELIREYRDRYFWIKNNYVDANILTVSYFEEEIARIETSDLNIEAEIQRISSLPHENKKKKELFLNVLNLDAETLFLITVTEDFTQWQDERKKASMFTAHYATRILDEIGRRTNIPTNLLKYLSPREVSRMFIDTPPTTPLKERQKCSVAYWDVAGHEIISGDTVHEINKRVLGEKKTDEVHDFRGMTASLGKAQGRVKILKSVKEIHRIEPGDVLVAVMTRPDYVPAMKKACAIVTDEGGITSHAAIVSRELKIPCVIGTKIATRVLHDGDLVQVNADHGLVKILERA
jgi:phosphohistidine swiveling domain-containing protein/transcriptional regulator with XRE-family HTH domain